METTPGNTNLTRVTVEFRVRVGVKVTVMFPGVISRAAVGHVTMHHVRTVVVDRT